MEVTRKSIYSGKVRTLDLPITQKGLKAWEGGELIQRVFPLLSADDREFLMTGITKEEWDEIFANEEE